MKFAFAILVLASAVVAASAATPLTGQQSKFLFSQWAKQHEKAYAADEFFTRFDQWVKNFEMIRSHNEEGGHSYTLGMNEFGDLSFDEFKTKYFGYKPRQRSYARSITEVDPRDLLDNVTVPDSVDWRTKNAVTPVKNQQQCGSCWAFSTTGSVEGAHALKTGKLVSLSEQQLVDCSTAEGNQGCNGGLMDNAFEFIIKNKGLCTEDSYPYKATGPNTCETTCTPVATISKYVDVKHNDEDALKAAAAIGPVSIAIEADQSAFQFYSGGVFDAACGTTLDHGVLIVGYGTQTGKDYWIVKNSWGATWGLKGYILLKRNTGAAGSDAGECGLALDPSYPVA